MKNDRSIISTNSTGQDRQQNGKIHENPAVEDQATDRAFRIGQQKNIFVHKFLTLGTLEKRIDQMIEDIMLRIACLFPMNLCHCLSKLDGSVPKCFYIKLQQ